ncbi:tyrosine-type recombinase/integrase [Candidatus Avoscillospira sp. LCP25S3_F1]|uniref:tyrosine-type recombinase/integrase n=1 Tax=Candidatus Avoscillospira sp. LCP25S3_F1 TaxID=3438825 RepID=UPI003F8F679B
MASNSQYRRWAKSLKNPTPVELPSGRWRCQITVNGKRLSIIEDDPRTAHAKALAIKADVVKVRSKPQDMTVREAIDRYIDSKDSVLSPTTIKNYRKIPQNNLQGIMGTRLGDLTQEAIQRAVNEDAKKLSPKSVRNAHGLLSAALREYYPDITLRTTLPQKIRHEIAIPTDAEVAAILAAAAGTDMELPLLLAIWMGLRQSEIRGITWDCINGNILHIRQAKVDGADGPVVKTTKTYSGDRKLRLPPYILEVISRTERKGEYLVTLSGQAIYKRFMRLCQSLGLPHYRFHDLRHLNASVMLALGVPNRYAQDRMGHATDNMLKAVYQHTMVETRAQVDDMVDAHFEALLHTDCTQKTENH